MPRSELHHAFSKQTDNVKLNGIKTKQLLSALIQLHPEVWMSAFSWLCYIAKYP